MDQAIRTVVPRIAFCYIALVIGACGGTDPTSESDTGGGTAASGNGAGSGSTAVVGAGGGTGVGGGTAGGGGTGVGGSTCAGGSTEGTPTQFDPDSCPKAYQAHFLDGTSATVQRCSANMGTPVYYGGQTNLGQCIGGICCNEMQVVLPTNFVKGTKVPAIIYMHGGGWATGDYGEGDGVTVEDYLRRGFAVLSLNYRLSPENKNATPDPNFFVSMKSGRADGPNPGATVLADVKTAVQYVRSNMGATIDGDNLVAMGHSAGAHLAVLLATTGSSTNANSDLNLRGRQCGVSTLVKAVVAKNPSFDFGLYVGTPDQLPVCGELLTDANKSADMCAWMSHPLSPNKYDSSPLGDLCVDQQGPGDMLPYSTWGSNYADKCNAWSAIMMGEPLVVDPSPTTNLYQWLVTPKNFLSATSAPIYVINGVCDATAPARGSRDIGIYAAETLGMTSKQFKVVLPQGAGHNDSLNETVNPSGNKDVRQWLKDNGLPIVVD